MTLSNFVNDSSLSHSIGAVWIYALKLLGIYWPTSNKNVTLMRKVKKKVRVDKYFNQFKISGIQNFLDQNDSFLD